MAARHARFRYRTAGEVLAHAWSLGLNIPFSEKISVLFQPIRIAGRTVSNRLAVQPMEAADADTSGAPSELTFRRYRRHGAGGCGIIWLEATAVSEAGKSNPRQLLLGPKTLGKFRELARKIKAEARKSAGLDCEPLLVLQLSHSGRFSKPYGIPAPLLVQHNVYLDEYSKTFGEHSVAPDTELERLQEAYVLAAQMAEDAGFDGVDIKACHGYLVSELLAGRNRTESIFGGPFKHRIRFLINTMKNIRKVLPRLLLACRLGAYDALPHPYGFGVDRGSPERFDLSEPLALIRELTGAGLELLNITAGIPAWKPHIGRPFDKPRRGCEIPDEHPLEGVVRLIELASHIQKAFPSIPVIGTGYSWLRQYFPNVAASVIGNGAASIIGLGRLSFAYPDFSLDLRENGRLDSRKVCLTCSGCSELLSSGRPTGCVVRDRGFYRRLESPQARKSITRHRETARHRR
jgi:2,4-dienoyl-CoA reductase (NADPH2)